MQEDDTSPKEIIIIKRAKNAGDDDHHGGVWKIAFADFMTAMMAFFLVMWLINASNEKTKKAVASYFNPIKLTDTTTNSKGLKNPKYGVDNQDKEITEDVVTINTPAKIEIKLATNEKKYDEQALFVDPYAILAEIEGGVGKDQGDNKQFSATDPGDGQSLNKGIEFQDPFDPNSWDDNQQSSQDNSSQEIISDDDFLAEQTNGLEGSGMMNGEEDDFVEVDEASLKDEASKAQETEADKSSEQTLEAEQKENLKQQELAEKVNEDEQSNSETSELSGESEQSKELEVAALGNQEGANQSEHANGELNIEKSSTAGSAEKEVASGQAEAGTEQSDLNKKIAEAETRIKEQLTQVLEQSNLTDLDVEVTASNEGVIVVLSDNNQNGMFNIGSARPTPALVKTMAKLGAVVGEQDGQVEISGHTDGRPYQSEDYDNWRLSTARAHMAYYMLVRGGMAENRVEKIVGQADKNLKLPDNPNSAANRRIEILIKPQ